MSYYLLKKSQAGVVPPTGFVPGPFDVNIDAFDHDTDVTDTLIADADLIDVLRGESVVAVDESGDIVVTESQQGETVVTVDQDGNITVTETQAGTQSPTSDVTGEHDPDTGQTGSQSDESDIPGE